MKSYLKIKIKSLAAEAAIIRHEERRVGARRRYLQERQAEEGKIARLTDELSGLHLHRVIDVRTEARCAQLAYAVLREMPYARVEKPGCAPTGHSGRIAAMVAKYGYVSKAVADERVKAWLGSP